MTIAQRSILCATDFSPVGNAAIAVAYGLARAGTVVHLVHVAEPAAVVNPIDGTILTYRTSTEELAEAGTRAKAKLRELVPESSLARDVRSELEVSHEVGAGAGILAAAKRADADIIVLGTHGRGGIARILMGSVAAEVMKGSHVPVVLVSDPNAK